MEEKHFGMDAILDLKEELRRFLEAYLNTKVLGVEDGSLRMHILFCKNNKNSKIKEKMVNYKLLRTEERLLQGQMELNAKDYYVCQFLIEELQSYVASSL